MAFEWWQIVIGILSLVGVGKLLELAYKARQERRKVQKTLDTSNAAAMIDQDVNAFNAIYKRLEIVEARLDDVQTALTNQKVENAKLEAENVRLSKDNERQEKEIERQRGKLHDLAAHLQGKDVQIIELTATLKRREKEIETLRSELHETRMEVNALSKAVKNLPSTSVVK